MRSNIVGLQVKTTDFQVDVKQSDVNYQTIIKQIKSKKKI